MSQEKYKCKDSRYLCTKCPYPWCVDGLDEDEALPIVAQYKNQIDIKELKEPKAYPQKRKEQRQRQHKEVKSPNTWYGKQIDREKQRAKRNREKRKDPEREKEDKLMSRYVQWTQNKDNGMTEEELAEARTINARRHREYYEENKEKEHKRNAKNYRRSTQEERHRRFSAVTYYKYHDEIRTRQNKYYHAHKDEINARRREKYQERKAANG